MGLSGRTCPSSGTKRGTKQGSALLVTLLVISLLLVVVMTFVVVVRQELRKVVNHQELMQARANARLGAELAVAKLQELMGPDQRVSARGEMFDGGVPNISGLQLPANMRRLVGVWDSTAFDEHNPGSHAGNAFLGWLISSGTSGQPFGLLDAPPAEGEAGSLLLMGPGTVAEAADHVRARQVRWENGAHAYAWMVDDHGLKAQLGAVVRNDEMPDRPPGGGVLPGAYPLGRLRGLSALDGVDPDDYQRLRSLRELPFLGGAEALPLAKERYFDFTPRSTGVLANTRDGGLKRDLTIAFENDTVFNRVFPTHDQNRYLVMDPEKLAQAPDLRRNGYIHWNIFKDYYNLKRYISRSDDHDVLDMHRIAKRNVLHEDNRYRLGTLAPHAMGEDTNPEWHRQLPYGDVEVFGYDRDQPSPYKHNYIGSILSFFQQNAWLTHLPEEDRLVTHVQIWASKYNPHNIGLLMRGNAQTEGPRLMNYPQVYFHISGVGGGFNLDPGAVGLGGNPQMNPQHRTVLRPGTSQLYGFEETVLRGEELNRGAYGPNVQNILTEHVYGRRPDNNLPESPEEFDLRVIFLHERANMLHGVDMNPESQGDLEVTQVIYAPYAWDQHNGIPAKIMTKRFTADELVDTNAMFSFGFRLRSTREPSADAIRPLVDGNIRALYSNPRWDSPLGMSTLALYASANEGEIEGMIPQMDTSRPPLGFTYWGGGGTPSRGHDRVVLFDVPRRDLVSLGQLQHAGAGRFSYEPSYIAGNSHANPRIPQNDWRTTISDTYSVSNNLDASLRIPGNFNLYDASYLVNQRMWDGHVFTTIPQVRDNYNDPDEPPVDYERIREGQQQLANPRFLPHAPEGSAFSAATLRDNGDSQGTRGSFFHNAGHVLVDGAFNVNSTSADAWEAFLTGTLELPVQGMNEFGEITGFKPVREDRVRFPRMFNNIGEGTDTENPDENFWIGFRELRQSEVRELAEAIVDQVKLRGPFLNMGQFVNRMLDNGPPGQSGALQAALDATVNSNTPASHALAAGHPALPDNVNQAAGFPGQLLQGDVLQALSPLMQVRSDTFTVRSYGEIAAPGGNAIIARAWCEMVVQRLPDPVVNDAGQLTPEQYHRELASPGSPFGRRFRVISFRWLNEEEI